MLVGTTAVDGTPLDQLGPGSRKKVRMCCDDCGKQTVTQFNNYTQAQRLHKLAGKTRCRKCGKKSGGITRRGRKNGKTATRNRQQRGDKHPSWKGGNYVNNHGYRMLYVGGGIPGRAGWTKYRPEHILVIEKQLGRKLRPGELVHHIDGDKLLNILLNLWLTDSKGHRGAHVSLQEIGYRLVRAGLISFDTESGTYVTEARLEQLLMKIAT